MKKPRVFLLTGIVLLTLLLVFTTLTYAQDDTHQPDETPAEPGITDDTYQPVQPDKTPAESEITTVTPSHASTTTAVQLDCGSETPVQVYFSDFEANDGGWSATNDWEHGVPTYPAGLGAHSGTNVWATKLITDHTNLGDSSLLTMTLDLSAVPDGLDGEMSWYQHLEANGSGFDRASVRVNGDTVYDSAVTGDDPVGYILRNADLSAYFGNPSVTIEFDFFATTVVNDPGWYIDDVTVAYCPTPVATIELEKTVGTDPAACAATSSIIVPAGTDVTYCYEVTNSGGITLTHHDLADSELGTILSGFPFELAPAASVFITQSVTNVQANVTNTATWTAYNAGPTDVVSATATADVTIAVSPLEVDVVATGGMTASESITFTTTVSNPQTGTNGAATAITATLDISISNDLDAAAVVTASYYDTSAPSVLLGTLTEADLNNCVDGGDETTPRDPFTSTVGNGINGGPLAAGSIICTVDVSGFGDALIDTMDYNVMFQPMGGSWDSEFRMFFDAPPYDRTYGVNFGGFGAGAPSATPVFGSTPDSATLQGVPTGASDSTWEVFLFESYNDAGEDPDSILITYTLDIYGWPYIETNPTLPLVPAGNVTLPSAGIASNTDFGPLLSPTIVEIVSEPDWDTACNSAVPVTWQGVGVVTDPDGFDNTDSDSVTHAGAGGPGCSINYALFLPIVQAE